MFCLPKDGISASNMPPFRGWNATFLEGKRYHSDLQDVTKGIAKRCNNVVNSGSTYTPFHTPRPLLQCSSSYFRWHTIT